METLKAIVWLICTACIWALFGYLFVIWRGLEFWTAMEALFGGAIWAMISVLIAVVIIE